MGVIPGPCSLSRLSVLSSGGYVVPLSSFSSFLITTHHDQTIVEVKTVMDFRGFDVEFQIPWQSPLYTSKPAEYISNLVGHEGPGSLHSYLKGKGWITYLSAGSMSQGRGHSRFGLNGNLTKEGFGAYFK